MELKTYYALDKFGNTVPGASVTVYKRGTDELATGIVDEAGTSLPNPFQSDQSGKATFAMPDGLYDMVISTDRSVGERISIQMFDMGGALTLSQNIEKIADDIQATSDRFGNISNAMTEIDAAKDDASNSAAQASANEAAAEKARDEAKQYAADAYNNAAASNIPRDRYQSVEEGLAAVAEGAYFSVPQGTGKDTSYIDYRKVNGQAVAVSDYPGVAMPKAALETANDVNFRTRGVNSSNLGKYPFQMIDTNGKGLHWIDANANNHFPAEIHAREAHIDSVQFPGGSNIEQNNRYRFPISFSDLNGKSLFHLDRNGDAFFKGIPYSNIRFRMPNKVAIMGDSISAFSNPSTASDPVTTNRNLKPAHGDQSWIAWAAQSCDSIIETAGVYATGGFTIAQITSTWLPQVIAAKPPACIVLAGRNDIYLKLDHDQALAGLANIYFQLMQAGILPILCKQSAQNDNDANQQLLRFKLNDLVVQLSNKYGTPYIAFDEVTANPQTGDYLPGLGIDRSHPTPLGAKAMGGKVAEVLLNWVKNTGCQIPYIQTDSASSTNLLSNSLFYSSTNNEPDGWIQRANTATGTSVISEGENGIKGMQWHLRGDSSSAAGREMTIPVTPGDNLGFGFKFHIPVDSPVVTNNVFIVYNDDGTTNTLSTLAGIRKWRTATDKPGYFYQEFVVPDTITSIKLIVVANEIILSQMGLFKITKV